MELVPSTVVDTSGTSILDAIEKDRLSICKTRIDKVPGSDYGEAKYQVELP